MSPVSGSMLILEQYSPGWFVGCVWGTGGAYVVKGSERIRINGNFLWVACLFWYIAPNS